jgi:hypothetical protein
MMNEMKFSRFQLPAMPGAEHKVSAKAVIILLVMSLLMFGCATVGKDFPVESVSGIQIGKTTQQDIREQFGSPWRVGIEDGQNTWTYGKYRYRLIGDASAPDLVIRFDNQDIVASFSFNTTEHMK